MKKTIIMALLAAASVSASAQQKQTIEIPSWLSGYGMTQYQYSGQKDAESNSFNIRMARISLEGRIAGDFYWKTQIQFNGNTSTLGSSPRMVDLFAEWQKYEYFKVKIGQFKNPFTFENPMHPIDQGFMGYSQNVSKLAGFSDRAGEHASNGRDIGLQFQGDFLKNANGRNLLHYQIGVFNGQGTNTKDVDQQKNVIGGVWVMPAACASVPSDGPVLMQEREHGPTSMMPPILPTFRNALAFASSAKTAMPSPSNTRKTAGPFAPNISTPQERHSQRASTTSMMQMPRIAT